MASLTQTVVGKGTLNPLIAEGLLKILRGCSSTLSSKIPYQFSYRMVSLQNIVIATLTLYLW